jgi:hypothetical protein
LFPRWYKSQDLKQQFAEVKVAHAIELSKDPVEFFEQVVGFEPTTYQVDFIILFKEKQFVAARWCRQSGKSWIISALLLWYAITHDDSYIAVVGPSWRQTKLAS